MPGSIVLTQALSRKYVGDENSVGKVIRLDNEYDLQVAGIMDDFPGNTHLQFDAVATLSLIWSENFPYRVPLNPSMFISGAIAVLFIAAIIIGVNVSRTAMENPVKSLQSE